MTPKNKCTVNVETSLHCKATAELSDSVINDMLKADGSLKDLLQHDTDQQLNHNCSNCNRSTEQ